MHAGASGMVPTRWVHCHQPQSLALALAIGVGARPHHQCLQGAPSDGVGNAPPPPPHKSACRTPPLMIY